MTCLCLERNGENDEERNTENNEEGNMYAVIGNADNSRHYSLRN